MTTKCSANVFITKFLILIDNLQFLSVHSTCTRFVVYARGDDALKTLLGFKNPCDERGEKSTRGGRARHEKLMMMTMIMMMKSVLNAMMLTGKKNDTFKNLYRPRKLKHFTSTYQKI